MEILQILHQIYPTNILFSQFLDIGKGCSFVTVVRNLYAIHFLIVEGTVILGK